MVLLRHVLALLCLALLNSALAEPVIRILLAENIATLAIVMPSAHRGYVNDTLRFQTHLGLGWPLQAHSGMLWSDGLRIGRSLTLEPVGDTLVMYGGTPYRGALKLVAVGDTIQVVNILGLESYLRGVVPSEMPPDWPLEALKAQAVAARTYTLANLKPEADYDVCATTDCQVYRGASAEHPRSDQALLETRGLVLTYGNAFARTYYHSDSGGAIASSAEVWGYSAPYLVALSDVATSTPHRQWEYRLDPAMMTTSLRGYGIDVGPVRALRILAYTESGRAQRAEVIGDRGRAAIEGNVLRTLLRGWGLKSTRITMHTDLVARGDGWGHGVGMSQYGARTMAQSGHRFEQILAFYYPSTQLQYLPEP
jgi:stage II sporulation protein D